MSPKSSNWQDIFLIEDCLHGMFKIWIMEEEEKFFFEAAVEPFHDLNDVA